MNTIIVICGPPCSGKTAIARELKDDPTLTPYAYLEMDEIRLSHWPGAHTFYEREKAYALMHEHASRAIREGAPGAILVATYQPSQQRHAVRAIADELSARLVVFECFVSAEVAVKRFVGRSESHAAMDLSPEKVWDLAHDFPYYDAATALDTDKNDINALVHSALARINKNIASTPKLDEWVALGNLPRSANAGPATSADLSPPKLSPRSRQRAKLRWWAKTLVFSTSSLLAFASFVVLMKAVVDQFFPELRQIGFEGQPGEWIKSWAAVALLASGLLLFFEHLFQKPEAKLLGMLKRLGKTPQLALRDSSPSNREVHRRYLRRVRPQDKHGFLLDGVPLWFVVHPREHGFNVEIEEEDYRTVDAKLLEDRAAKLGLDWSSFFKWRESEKRRAYFDWNHEKAIRVLGLETSSDPVKLKVCRGSYVSHLCTEQAANLHTEGRFGFEMRQVFEGPGWSQTSPGSQGKYLDLQNIGEASRTYEMLIGVHTILTTEDGYLILQRRSSAVQAAGGGAASSSAGSALWEDMKDGNGALIKAALRETKEEIGWVPHGEDDRTAPFLGAAFSLLRGRDLNFYCHFHTHWKLEEISKGRRGWRRRFRLPIRHPSGVTRAKSAWEVAEIVPVPIEALKADGRLEPPFHSIVGEARHLQGMLYCLAKSEKFQDLVRKQKTAMHTRDRSG